MSWRQVLGIEKPIEKFLTHNTQNAHKIAETENCADNANSAEGRSKLSAALSAICNGHAVTPEEVRNALAPDDIENWQNGDITADMLEAFAKALAQRHEMNQGKAPTHYTKRAICKQCGPVWLWFSGEVLGCP